MTVQNETAPKDENPRPRPAFGEYAPEGWEWKPEGEAADAPQNSAGTAASSTQNAGSARPANLPHNLGVSRTPNAPANSQSASSGASGGDPEPYRGVPQQQPFQGAPYGTPVSYGQQQGQRPRTGDRVITIVLLVLGALGALLFAQGMFALSSSFSTIGVLLDLENFTPPVWVATLGTVSGFALLALYAVVLLFSIRRMRAGKLTFWVPLVAGVVSIIAVFVVMMIAMNAMPDLVQRMSDPTAVQELYENLLSATS